MQNGARANNHEVMVGRKSSNDTNENGEKKKKGEKKTMVEIGGGGAFRPEIYSPRESLTRGDYKKLGGRTHGGDEGTGNVRERG